MKQWFGAKTNKGLLVILVCFLTAIVILVVANVVVLLNRKKDEVRDEEQFSLTIENWNTLQAIKNEVDSLNEKEAMEFLDNKILEYQESELGLEISIVKINVLSNLREFDKALELADELLERNPEVGDEMKIYRAYAAIYNQMGNLEKLNESQNLYLDAYAEYFDGGFEAE